MGTTFQEDQATGVAHAGHYFGKVVVFSDNSTKLFCSNNVDHDIHLFQQKLTFCCDVARKRNHARVEGGFEGEDLLLLSSVLKKERWWMGRDNKKGAFVYIYIYL